ncbi:MAG: LytR C-terminal domain-containing protein [Beutenbergiaceae bacterium]
MTQSPEAVRARVARRRHLQQRQTVIFGALIAALLVAGLLGIATWTNIIPSPISIPLYSGPPPAPVAEQAPPCPPEGALPVAYSQVSANVFNGTDTSGLAALTGASLRNYGIQTGRESNGTTYGGVAEITTGELGIPAAYTVAALFTDSQIVLDSREDGSIDILLGAQFEDLIPLEEVALDPEAPIAAPADCQLPPTPEPTEAVE